MVISPRQDVGVNTGKLCMVMESVCVTFPFSVRHNNINSVWVSFASISQ